VPEAALRSGEVLEHLARLTPAGRLPVDLFDSLYELSLLARAGRPRGKHAKVDQRGVRRQRAGLVSSVRYLAAFADDFAKHQLRLPLNRRHPLVRQFSGLRNFPDWSREEQRWRLARLIVMRKFPREEWVKHGLKVPSLDHFSRHYLKRGRERDQVKRVLKRARSRSARLLFPWGSPSNVAPSAWIRDALKPRG